MSAGALAIVPLEHLRFGCDRHAPVLGQTENLGLCRCDCPDPDANGDVQCPWVSCRYHLAIDVHMETGTLKSPAHESGLTVGTRYDRDQDPDAWIAGVLVWMDGRSNHCALAEARKGSPALERTHMTLQEVADELNCTRERARQIEAKAVGKLRRDPDVQRLLQDALGEAPDQRAPTSAFARRIAGRRSLY